MGLPGMDEAKKRYAELKAKNYTQLINKNRDIKINKKILEKEATIIRKESNKSIKWSSPFKDKNIFKQKFQGKDIVSKKI